MSSKRKLSISCILSVILGVTLLQFIWVPQYSCESNQILYELKVYRKWRPSEISANVTACCGTANGGCKGVDWVPEVCFDCNCWTGCCDGKWGSNCSRRYGTTMFGMCKSHVAKVILLEKFNNNMAIWGVPIDIVDEFSPQRTGYPTIIFNKSNDIWSFVHDGVSTSLNTGSRPQKKGYISPTKIIWDGVNWDIQETTAKNRCISGCLKFSHLFSPPRSIEIMNGNNTIGTFNKVSFGIEEYESTERYRNIVENVYSICINPNLTPFHVSLAIAAMNITMNN